MAQEGVIMSTNKSSGVIKDGDKILPQDYVTIEWVNSPYHKKGSTDQVHKALAQKLIEYGRAKYPGDADPEYLTKEKTTVTNNPAAGANGGSTKDNEPEL